jgi:FMN phosphatase YigB (HAD superfamily)
VHASADALKLITFDADGTLYADGHHFEQDNAMIAHIINLMRCNVHVRTLGPGCYNHLAPEQPVLPALV